MPDWLSVQGLPLKLPGLSDKKLTVPVGTRERPMTVAVQVVAWPTATDVGEQLTLVEVESGFTVQVNDALSYSPVVSFAVTVTLNAPFVVGVPEISPVEELMLTPAGKPDALQVNVVWLGSESVAVILRSTGSPTVLV
jgi:hypothetical protein